MLFPATSITWQSPKKSKASAAIIARQDRIPVWALSHLFIGVIGLGFLFTFFDIGDINVSFIQTCLEIVPHCLPQTASHALGLPVLTNLAGYVVGALLFGPLADHYGRRDLLVLTMVITGLGSLYTVFVGDYTHFVIARTITGIGIGADLALVNTYLNEMAPNQGRARYTALIFILAQIGTILGVWSGLVLSTTPAPFPLGLPFAVASSTFVIGWRIIYAIGASLAIFGLLLRFKLPESPRWLISQGRLADAERVVSAMEKQAIKCIGKLPPVNAELPIRKITHSTGYTEIFGSALYLKRTILLLVIWLTGYITVYCVIAGLTVILATLGYPASEAGLIAAVGTAGSIFAGIIAYCFGERLESKFWILISALLTLLGGILIALSGSQLVLAFLGSSIIAIGSYLWLPLTYTWSTENYPTRARVSGFALVDGVGHIGGGIGVNFIASFALKLGAFPTFLLISLFLLLAAGLAQFGPATRRKRLDEVSP